MSRRSDKYRRGAALAPSRCAGRLPTSYETQTAAGRLVEVADGTAEHPIATARNEYLRVLFLLELRNSPELPFECNTGDGRSARSWSAHE